MTPLSPEAAAILMIMFAVTLIVIVVATVTINGVICHMSRKLFKAMVYMKYRDLPFTLFEINGIYKEECEKHGFDEVQ